MHVPNVHKKDRVQVKKTKQKKHWESTTYFKLTSTSK